MFHVCCLPGDPLLGRLGAEFIAEVYHPREDRRLLVARGLPFRSPPDLIILGADGCRPLWHCDPTMDPEVLEQWRHTRHLCDDRSQLDHPDVVPVRLRPHPLDADVYADVVAMDEEGIPLRVTMTEEQRNPHLHPGVGAEVIRRWPHAAWEEVMGVRSTSDADSSAETCGEEDGEPSWSEPDEPLSDDSWTTDESS